jgi:hypothetical protein
LFLLRTATLSALLAVAWCVVVSIVRVTWLN